jgi:RasGEF domain
MEPFHSYGRYREDLKKASPPYIPFLGVFLKDLTYIDDGNPTFEGDRVNWTKLKLVCDFVYLYRRATCLHICECECVCVFFASLSLSLSLSRSRC